MLPPWSNDQQPFPSLPELPAAPETLPEQMRAIWDRGGWDHRIPPRDAWQRYHGGAPFPDVLDFAAQPTFGPVDSLLEDQSITDIHLNGPGRELLTRRSGDVVELAMHETWHRDWLDWLVKQFRSRGRGKDDVLIEGTADATRPGRRQCVLRYLITMPPLCPHGPSITIRVLRPGTMSLQKLVELETMPPDASEFLAGCVRANIDIYITGLPGTGKTTLAQALLTTVADQRLICIEDIPEIVVDSKRAVNLELSMVSNLHFDDLIRMSLRMNAQRIVVGETRGKEAYAVLAAASNGFPVITTLHGDSAAHGLHSLAVKANQAAETGGKLEVSYAMLNARPSILISLARRDGRRQIDEILEVQRQYGDGRPITEQIYAWEQGRFRRITYPSHALRERLEAVGARIEDNVDVALPSRNRIFGRSG
jgi:pilus assembly protein CpaF